MKTLIVYVSFHHHNTEKVARAIGEILDATLVNLGEVERECLSEYDLLGFGSGIYFASMDTRLLDFIGELPPQNKNVFIFSTRGLGARWIYHRLTRKKLKEKGYVIVGEFSCKGFDTVGPLKYIGGINRGRPHSKDLEKAREFARKIRDAVTR